MLKSLEVKAIEIDDRTESALDWLDKKFIDSPYAHPIPVLTWALDEKAKLWTANNTAGLSHPAMDLGGLSSFFVYEKNYPHKFYRVLASGFCHYDMMRGQFTDLDDAKDWCERRNAELVAAFGAP